MEELCLRISPEDFDKLVAYCVREAPIEACGIMSGQDGRVKSLYFLKNVEESPVKYLMDPKEQLEVMTEIWDKGEELVAIFHSHPHTEAYPSETDVKLAFYPDAFYVIVSLAADTDVRAFKIKEGIIKEAQIILEE